MQSLKPLSAASALGEQPILKEPRLVDQWSLWLEQRPNEGGRTTAFIRPWGKSGLPPQELTPAPIDLRTRVHTYGGGALTSFVKGDQLLLTWIDDLDGCLWSQVWKGLSGVNHTEYPLLESLHSPRRLSAKGDYLLADGLIDPFRQRWIGIMEKDGRDFLVAFLLDQSDQAPIYIYEPLDFAGYSALSPDGAHLVWVEWQQPSMPWEESALWLGSFDEKGFIEKKKLLAGSIGEKCNKTSVFQPQWLSSGELVVSEDGQGWWNLMIHDFEIDDDASVGWSYPWPMKAETAFPQWIYGLTTTAFTGERLVSLNCKNASWQIDLLSLDGSVTKVEQPFDDLTGLDAKKDHILAIGSNATTQPGLLEIDLNDASWIHTIFGPEVINKSQISIPESFWFKGFKGRMTHAWYYPPAQWDGHPAPLLVKSHSGPTSMATRGLNLGIQFWTSRGWGVVDVNYGGSTGFGRSYRERLMGSWGEVDVFDCAAAAEALVASGQANNKYVAIEGGSAGGFTTLSCLCFTDVFSVGACRYAVSDLVAMSRETHRFEEGYLDHLLGPLLHNRHLYYERSPLNNAERINCPVVFFQGMKDKVVLPSQTQKMVDILRAKDVPVELYTFDQEGHGFKDSRVKIKVLEKTEQFFRRYLGL